MSLRHFGRNALIYMVGNAGLRAVSFLLIPLYTHMLSQAEFGMLFTLLFTMQILLVLTNLGIRESLTRFVTEAAAAGRTGELLGSALASTLAGGLAISAAGLLFFVPLLGRMLHSDRALEYLALGAAATVAQALSGQLVNYYRATNQALRFMFAGLATAVLLVVANLAALWWLRLGIRGVLLAQLVTYLISAAAVAALILPGTGLALSRRVARQVVAFGAPLVMAEFCWTLMTAAPVYFLGHWAGLEAVAIYSLGFKLAQAVTVVLILPFDLAYAPFVFANLGRPDIRQTMSRVLTYFVLAFGAAAFLALVGSRELIKVIAPGEYSGALLVLLFLLPAIAFEGLHAFAKTQLLIRGRTRIAGVIAAVVGAVSLGLNFALVPAFGLWGAVGASDLATAMMGMLVLAAGMRSYPVDLDYRRIAVASLGFTAFGALFLVMRDAPAPVFYPAVLLPAAAVAGLLYAGRFFSESERRLIRNAMLGIPALAARIRSRRRARGLSSPGPADDSVSDR